MNENYNPFSPNEPADDPIRELPDTGDVPVFPDFTPEMNTEELISDSIEIDTPIPPSPPRIQYDPFMHEPIGFETANYGGYRRPYSSSDLELKPHTVYSEEKSSKRLFAGVMTLLIAVICISIVCVAIDIKRSPDLINNYRVVTLQQQSKPVTNENQVFQDENGRYTSEGVAAKVRPSIVEIFTYADTSSKMYTATGSGIIISADGYVVTNAHVLNAEGGFHEIVTYDDATYRAEIVGRDAKTDIAVLKLVGATDLIPAELGNSDEVLVGEQVMAIGNPAGLSGTVTNGIVSAVNRLIRGDSTGFEMNCIQTNAAISPGNSGGALVNMYCQVIGITSSKYVNSSYEGLGFAITINEAIPIIEELISNGHIGGRFRVGISLMASDSDYLREKIEEELGFSMPEGFEGVYISSIAEDADIAKTALKPGDFIIKIGDKSVKNYNELINELKKYEIGESIPATCAHLSEDGKVEEYEIEFKTMPDTSGNY